MDELIGMVKTTFSALGEAFYIACSIIARACNLVYAGEYLARRYRWCLSMSWPLPFILRVGKMAEVRAPLHVFEAEVVRFYEADDHRELMALVNELCAYDAVSKPRKAILREVPEIVRASVPRKFNAAAWLLPRLFVELEGVLRDYARVDLGQLYLANDVVKLSIRSLHRYASSLERPALRVITDHLFRNTRKMPARHKRISRNLHLHGLTKAPATMASVIRVLLMIDLVANLIDQRRGIDLTGRISMRITKSYILSKAKQSGRRFRELEPRCSSSALRLSPAAPNALGINEQMREQKARREQIISSAIDALADIPSMAGSVNAHLTSPAIEPLI